MGRSPIEREFILSRWALATQLAARFPSSRQWVGFTWLNWCEGRKGDMPGSICSTEFVFSHVVWLIQNAVEGFRFNPTEPELINYLKAEEPRHRGGFCIIPTLKNITNVDPDKLPPKFVEKSIVPSNGRDWWFICKQTQNQRVRVRRKTPCGSSWRITGQPRDITIAGKQIGFKKILAFSYDETSEGSKSDWIIHEYHLPENSPNPSGNNILCHLMRKTAGSKHEAITSADVEQLLNQFNDEPVVQEGISPTLHTFTLPYLLQLIQRNTESISRHQSTNIGRPYADLSDAEVQNGEEPDKSIELESSLRTTEDNEWADSLLHLDDEVQLGEGPSLEKVQQKTAARNVEPCISSDEAATRAKLLQCEQSKYNSSSSTVHQFMNRSPSDVEFSYAKVQKGEEPRFKKVWRETAARNIKDEAAARAKNGQIFTRDDRRSKVKPPNCVFPPEETKGIPTSPVRSSRFSDFREFGGYFDQPADQEKGSDHEEHNLADGSPKKRRFNVSKENQIQ